MKQKYNSNKKLVKEIKSQLKESDGYCPSRAERSVNTKCPCLMFREQLADGIPGECLCGLFVATE